MLKKMQKIHLYTKYRRVPLLVKARKLLEVKILNYQDSPFLRKKVYHYT